MSNKQRLAISGLLVAGIGLLLLAALSGADDRTDITVSGNPAIDALIPLRESEILQRDKVGIDLADGFEAALTLHAGGRDIPVPSDQLDQNFQSLGEYTFRPAEGKVLESFPPQSNCVTATFWPANNRDDVGSITWCFQVL